MRLTQDSIHELIKCVLSGQIRRTIHRCSLDPQGRITYKQVGALGRPIITAKLDEALHGIVSAQEGRGDYRSVR